MSIGTASNFKVGDCLINGSSIRRIAKRPVAVEPGGGGGGDWILANGVWDDAGVWDDTAVWKDVA